MYLHNLDSTGPSFMATNLHPSYCGTLIKTLNKRPESIFVKTIKTNKKMSITTPCSCGTHGQPVVGKWRRCVVIHTAAGWCSREECLLHSSLSSPLLSGRPQAHRSSRVTWSFSHVDSDLRRPCWYWTGEGHNVFVWINFSSYLCTNGVLSVNYTCVNMSALSISYNVLIMGSPT